MRMQKLHYLVLLAGSLLLAAAFSLSGADGRTYVIRDAKVYTMGAAGTLDRASIVIDDGKIADVGPSVKTPSGALVIQGKGLEVYPGMVNGWSNIGLTEIPSVDVTNDSSEMGDYKPQIMAYPAIHPASEHFAVARVDGVTTSISAPGGGIISGQAALLHLAGWTVEEMAIERSAGMVVNYPSLGGGRGFRGGFGGAARRQQPFSELKREYEQKIAALAEWLEKARHYGRAMEANAATPRDRQLEALLPVVRGEMLVFLQADSARDIRNAVEFGKKEKLKFLIVGGREALDAADILKKENVAVILGSVYSMPARDDDPYDAPYTVPARLFKAGVRFALSSPSSTNMRTLPYEAGMSVAYGLPRDEALKAITSYPAEMLGVADKIGSIEKGKIADLVVTDGDLLELRTNVKNVFVAGENTVLESKHTRLYKQYMSRP